MAITPVRAITTMSLLQLEPIVNGNPDLEPHMKQVDDEDIRIDRKMKVQGTMTPGAVAMATGAEIVNSAGMQITTANVEVVTAGGQAFKAIFDTGKMGMLTAGTQYLLKVQSHGGEARASKAFTTRASNSAPPASESLIADATEPAMDAATAPAPPPPTAKAKKAKPAAPAQPAAKKKGKDK